MKNIKLYKQITLDIIKCIEDDNVRDLEMLFEKRQNILDEEKGNEKFIIDMIESGIVELDNNIKVLLNESITKTKLEIKKQKIFTTANNYYINSSKENLNIFNKKV